MNIRFEWDRVKAEANFRKHGVSFETAILAFRDPYAILELDRIEDGERRWKTVGMAAGFVLLVVAHTIRDAGGEIEIIRIISARRAERKERRRYEEEAR